MILVTGGTGFVGRHLVSELLARGRTVRVLTRAPERPGRTCGVDIIGGDLADASLAQRAVEGVATVVHLAAALPTPGSPADACSRNGLVTRNLARAARASGVRTFIHVSSAGVYGDGTTAQPHREDGPTAAATPYERSKLEAERTLFEELTGSAVSSIVLRPTGIHGPGRLATAAWYRQIARKRFWIHGPVQVIVQPTDVGDAVQAIAACEERFDLAGEVINVAGERALPYEALIALVAARINASLKQVKVPSWPARPAATALARGLALAGVRVPEAIERSSRGMINRSVDTTKARSLLKLDPVPLERSIARTADWYLALTGEAPPPAS